MGWAKIKQVLDLDKPNCHVCGKPLRRNLTTEKEFCINMECQVQGIKFNISYKPVTVE